MQLGDLRARTLGVLLTALAVTAALAGCGRHDVVISRPAPAAMLLSPASLPNGFSVSELSVADLVKANGTFLSVADTAQSSPPDCRPSADAKLNPQLSPTNAAVLAASGMSAGFTELVTTATRDVDADLAAGSGDCAVSTMTITKGAMRGAVVTTEHRRISTPALAGGSAGDVGRAGSLRIAQLLLLRNTVTTRLADGSSSNAVGLAGYALARFAFDAAGSAPLTVALTVSGTPSEYSAHPAAPVAPMSDADFADLMGKALAAAGDAPK